MAEPTLTEIVREAINSSLLDLHVALPGRIESYDPATQTADVLPMIRRAVTDVGGNTLHEELPVIPNVLVHFPRSAAFSMTWPLAKGDHVLLVFNSSAIGNWRETGDVSDPGDLRRHDLSYPVAIAGIAQKGETIPTAPDAAVIEVNPPATHVAVGAGATEFAVLATKMITEFNTHTHTVPIVGAAGTTSSSVPTAPLTAAQIAATKLKSE